MSRIGRKKIEIGKNVKIEIKDGIFKVSGPMGELKVPIHKKVQITQVDGLLVVERKGDDKLSRALHGTTRALIANAITGVTSGFEKKLEIVGVGYRAQMQEDSLMLKLGYSHDINLNIPEGLTVEIKKNIVSIKGIDKQAVGQFAAEIRELRKPEPYKGKGIKYVGEHIIRKVGKAVKGATSPGA